MNRAAIARLMMVALLAFSTGCGGSDEVESAAVEETFTVPPIAGSPAAPPPPNPPVVVADIFPATGDRGRVVNHCSTCHSVACTALGQRTPAQWEAVAKSHEYYIPGLSKEDFGKIFDYLLRNFNDTMPEPVVPERFLVGGCPRLPSYTDLPVDPRAASSPH